MSSFEEFPKTHSIESVLTHSIESVSTAVLKYSLSKS